MCLECVSICEQCHIYTDLYMTQVYINECVYKCRYRAHIYVINIQDPKYISSQTQVIKRHKCGSMSGM